MTQHRYGQDVFFRDILWSCYGSVMHASETNDTLSLQQNDAQTLLHVFSSLAQSSPDQNPAFLSKFLSALAQTGEQCAGDLDSSVCVVEDAAMPSAKRTKIKKEK